MRKALNKLTHWVPPLVQMSIEQLGYIAPPPLPMNVTGQMDLTQGMSGPMDNGTAATRGYVVVPSGMPYFSNASQVRCPATEPLIVSVLLCNSPDTAILCACSRCLECLVCLHSQQMTLNCGVVMLKRAMSLFISQRHETFTNWDVDVQVAVAMPMMMGMSSSSPMTSSPSVSAGGRHLLF